MIRADDRAPAVAVIGEAVAAGAGCTLACAEAGIDRRTLYRWTNDVAGEVCTDARPTAPRATPSNALSAGERTAALAACHEQRFADAPTGQIVPALADEGRNVGSESTLYRLLHQPDEQQERGRGDALVLHADNRAPQRSSTLSVTLERLGISASFSRPRAGGDNAYADSLLRTAKYPPGFPVDSFTDIGAARDWVLGFVRWSNGIEWLNPEKDGAATNGAVQEAA